MAEVSTASSLVTLRDVLASIRSKNAGPFSFTIDLFFRREVDFDAVIDQRVLTAEVVGARYDVDPAVVKVHNFRPALAIKVAIPHDIPAGSPGDRDIFSGQQFVPLLDLTLHRPD